MRRRQIADAPTQPNAETGADTAAETTAPSLPESSDNAAAEAPAPTPAPENPETTGEAAPAKRRRAPRRKAETAASDAPAEEIVLPPEPEVVPVPQTEAVSEAEVPKPRRAPRRRKADPETPSEAMSPVDPAPIAEAVPAEAVVVAEETAPAAESPLANTVTAEAEIAVETPTEAKPRRPRRGRKQPEAASEETPTAPDETTVPLAAVSVEAAETVADVAAGLPDAPRPQRRRRGQVPTTTAAEGIVQAPEVPVTAASGTAPVARRTRGLRQAPAAPTPALPPAPVYVPDAASAEAAAPETGTAPVRTRGLRRSPRRIAVQAPGEPILAAPSVAPTAPAVPLAYQPLPLEILQRFPEARVSSRHGLPELTLNGVAQLPFWFFVNTEDPDTLETAIREMRLAYEAGVRFFTVLAHLPWKKASGERRSEPLDEALRLVAENAPDAWILPRLIFSPPTSWQRTHEDDMTVYADGETGDVSLASRTFWEEDAPDALCAAVEQMVQSQQASRIWGIYLEHGEWFYERGRGLDVSEANTQGFRSWLRTFYKGSLVALRAAWHDGEVTFDNAPIAEPPVGDSLNLFWGPREQRFADYYRYASDIVAQVINRLGKTVKEASANRLAVAVSYGYTLELPRAGSGHLALAQVLSASDIDILTGPVSYSSRTSGGSAPFPAPVDSIHLAGKLWVSEDDTKTYLAAPDESADEDNPQMESLAETLAVYTRNFGAALSHGAGISYMDLWGQGWLADRQIWEHLGRLRQIGEQVAALRRDSNRVAGPDVAVIVDERSFFGVRADEELLRTLVADTRDTLLRSGARIGWFLMSDLEKNDFPGSARLLLFLNAFQIPEMARITLRERFQADGRTLAFLYGPGAREENLAELADALGIQLRTQPWGSKVGTQVLSQVRSPLTDGVTGQRLGDEERVNPSLYVSDPKAQTLGEYLATGNPSFAVRRHTRFQTVFLGERDLTLPLLRGLYRLAGVPIFTVDDDVAWIDDQLLCLHSAPGGGTTLHLPDAAGLADLLTGEVLSADGYGARFAMPPRGTRLLLAGTPEEAARFGIDLRAGAPGLTEDERLAVIAPFAGEVVSAPRKSTEPFLPLVPTISSEDEDLFVAALAGEIDLADKESDEDSADADETDQNEEAGARKKRRRRRRGRGSADETATETAEVVSGGEEPFLPVSTSARPSLSDLLPLSELPSESELPPIPEEFLPLEASLSVEADEATSEGEGGRRARRGRSRRGRRGEATSEETLATAVVETSQSETVDQISDATADLAEAEQTAGMTELTSVGLDENEAAPTQTPSGIAAVPSDTNADLMPTPAEEIADAAEALGADEADAEAVGQEIETEVSGDAPLEEPRPSEEADAETPIPNDRPDVSSGEGNPS